MAYSQINAVITGDLIGSSKLDKSKREMLFEGLKELLGIAENGNYDIFRGDSFQGIIYSPIKSLEEAIRIRAGLRQIKKGSISSLWDARIAIGMGKIEFMSSKVSEADGEAFRKSGPALDKMSGEERLAFNSPWESVNEELEATFSLLDAVINNWSSQQAEVVVDRIQGLTQEEISKKIHVSQAAVNQRLKAANWSAVQKVLQRYEKLIKVHLSSK